MKKEPIYGAHMSIAKGFPEAARKTRQEYGANAMQVFLKSPRGRKEREITDLEAKEFKAACVENQIAFVVGHCSYLLNFAQDVSQDPWTLESLISDLKNIHRLGGAGIVLHIGKYLKIQRQESYEHLAKNISRILEQTESENNFVILENTAGQGTEIGWQMSEMEYIYKEVLKKHPRIRFCFDLAHAFAAGYDLRDKEGVKKTFDEFDSRLGIEKIALIHFNDSIKEFSSRVDRHANLEEGKIGRSGMGEVIQIAMQYGIPLILETPEDEKGSHIRDIEILRRWLGEIL